MPKKNDDMKFAILNYIAEHMEEFGYPPSVREICVKVGLSSPSTVHGYLARMEKEGLIQRDSTKTRAIRITKEDEQKIDKSEIGTEEFIEVPVIGNVAAGSPILAQEQVTDVFPLPSRFVGKGQTFMLTVHGDSMINVGIFSGDLVIVSQCDTAENGEIIVALMEDRATVKTFYKEANGRIRLQPENDFMEPIYPKEIKVIGKVIGLFRNMKQ